MQTNKNIYSVKQVNYYIKRMFEDDIILREICVKGEISNCKYHSSGHIYFSLKDDSGVLQAVMFSSFAAGLSFRLEEGMEVIVSGSVRTYERDGKYQLYARSIEQSGKGDLYRKFEELKERLAASGMFDNMYKKPIPEYAMKIGVVTAQTGSVIRDIYNVASRRNPYCQIILYPAKVQGEGAARSISNGIRELDRLHLDVIIAGRGGGSIEDLWAFNEEEVAYAIFNAVTPVVSAVGHETDYTIADFVADLRAPTPSAAAELSVFDYDQFVKKLEDYRFNMEYNLDNRLREYKDLVEKKSLKLKILSPEYRIEMKKQKLYEASEKLQDIMDQDLNSAMERIKLLAERLEGMSPLKRLSAGYAYVTSGDNRILNSIARTFTGDMLNISLMDGDIKAEVKEILRLERE